MNVKIQLVRKSNQLDCVSSAYVIALRVSDNFNGIKSDKLWDTAVKAMSYYILTILTLQEAKVEK